MAETSRTCQARLTIGVVTAVMSHSWNAFVPMRLEPGDAQQRGGVHLRVGDRRDQIRRPRSRGREHDAGRPAGTRVALRHVPGALLVADEHVAERAAACQGVVDGQDGTSRHAEHRRHALGLEAAQHQVGAELRREEIAVVGEAGGSLIAAGGGHRILFLERGAAGA
jgi:hypothetical protein